MTILTIATLKLFEDIVLPSTIATIQEALRSKRARRIRHAVWTLLDSLAGGPRLLG